MIPSPDDIWMLSDGGSQIVEQRINMQLELQRDPTAMALLRSAYVAQEKACALIDERMEGAQHITDEEFTEAYGDLVKMQTRELAIITVDGPISTNASYWDKYYSQASYSRLREALDTMVYMGEVKDVLWVWRSPGGNAKGSFSLAEHMEKLQKAGLRMTSFADTAMMSAAILLGMVPKEVFAAADADIGSVGAMSTMFTRTKQLEMNGVQAHTFKYGRLKDIGSPYRDMTEEEKAFFQSRIDRMGAQIVESVQRNSGLDSVKFQAVAGEAKIVFGSEAAAVGLINGVKSLEQVVNTILARHNAAKVQTAATTGAHTMKYKLNAKGLAAVQAGMVEADALLQADLREEDTGTETDASLLGNEQPAPTPTPVVPPAMDLTTLVTQLTEAKAQVLDLTAKLAESEGKLTSLGTQVESLSGIAVGALLNLEVACNNVTATEASVKALGVEGMVARHAELKVSFQKRLKPGPQAAPADSLRSDASTPQNKARLQAQLDAVNLG